MSEPYPIVQISGGSRHAVWASGSPGDGNLRMFVTCCGVQLASVIGFREVQPPTAVTCKRCLKSLRAADSPRARRTLALGEA